MDGSRRSALWHGVSSALAENLGLKVASLLIAMALFGMVRGAGNVQRSLEVSLLARLPPPAARRVLTTDLPDKVRVTLRGSPSLVGSLRTDELGPVQIDLSDGHRPLIAFDPSLFQLPGGVQLAAIQPSTLQLSWDNLVDRIVPVRATLSGAPAPGNRLAQQPDVYPPTVGVSGPGLYVGALSAVRTDVIDISGLAPGQYERRVALDTPRPHVRYDANDGVRVTFAIEHEILQRRFDHVPVTPVGALRVEIRPPMVSVVVRGPPQRVNAVDASEIVPIAETDGATAAVTRVGTRFTVQLSHVPDGLTLVAIEPSEVIIVPAR